MDSKDYHLSLVILNNISIVIKGYSINEEKIQMIDQEKNETPLKIFSISDKTFQNKGSNAKSHLLIGKNGIFSQSKKKEYCLFNNKQKNNISVYRSKENNYFGPTFEMEPVSNFSFFNQALQTLFHCKMIFNWYKETNPSKLKSLILIDFNFVVFVYYSFSKEEYVLMINHKNDSDLIEYEIISISFFSSDHFYSFHLCWNNHKMKIQG